MPAFYILAALILAALRVSGEKCEAFQAASHIFVGMLLYAAVIDRKKAHAVILGVLSLVELACFIAGKL